MNLLIPCKGCGAGLDCFSTDPLDLYSIDGPTFGFVLNCPPGYNCNNATFTRMICCGVEFIATFPPGSTVSQKQKILSRVRAQCRQQQEFCSTPGDQPPPVVGEQLYYSKSISSSSQCPASGQASVGVYTFTLPAGSYIARTQIEANRLAEDYANKVSKGIQFCISFPGLCACVNQSVNLTAQIRGGAGPFHVGLVSGTLPNGTILSIVGSKVRLSGIPTSSGTSNVRIMVTDSSGGRWEQSVVIRIITISTSSLPAFSQGVPYSYQLIATGGSGSYAWKLTGSLPTGLDMTIGGLIFGTPTGVSGTSFSVSLIDLSCQEIDRSFYRPVVSLVGRSTTTIATVRGFDELGLLISSPPKKYMRRMFAGNVSGNDASGQPAVAGEAQSMYLFAVGTRNPVTGEVPLATAHNIMNGVDEINLQGQTISTATLQLYDSCPGPNNIFPQVLILNVGGQMFVPGWCFSYDISMSFSGLPSPTYPKCTSCNFPLLPDNSVGQPYTLYRGSSTVTSSTHAENTSQYVGDDMSLGVWNNPPESPGGVFFPPNLAGGLLPGKTLLVRWKHNYTIDLSVEYTDSMALANALVFTSDALTAVNSPRTVGFVSTYVAVSFDLKLRNLVFGESYVVSVDLRADAFGTVTTRQYNFTATTTTHTITDTVPTPSAGHTITARNARVAYAT